MKVSRLFGRLSWLKINQPQSPFVLTLFFCSALCCVSIYAGEMFVTNTSELRAAINRANNDKTIDPISIILDDGEYSYAKNLVLSRSNLKIVSNKNDAKTVILSGNGMRPSNNVELIFDIRANNITLSGLTLKNVSNHLIQVRAEKGVSFFTLENCILQNSYQQMLKVSGNNNDLFSDFGLVENNRFEYTAGIGPNFYIGGIDAHKARHWVVSHNTFLNIASPAERVAEHAIHFWQQSSNNIVTNNVIINSDRGIGFGMGNKKRLFAGGKIALNKIIHNNKDHLFADVGIILESSPNTVISNNDIQLNTSYPNAIEYRFPHTQNVIIEGNKTNKAIISRDGADATLINNESVSSIERYWDTLMFFVLKATRAKE